MNVNGILDDIPTSSQNPLLPLDTFADFCCKRFRSASSWGVRDRLRDAASAAMLRPLVTVDGHYLYSTFQVWQFAELMWAHSVGLEPQNVREFERVLLLLTQIQDYYLPEVRGNRRYGQWLDYRGTQVLGGTWFRKTLTCLVSNLRRVRDDALRDGRLNPEQMLTQCELSASDLDKWQHEIHFDGTGIDPLLAWRDLVAVISYEERQQLKYEALLAQDFYEIVEILRLFSVDAGFATPAPEFVDPTDVSGRDAETGLPHWKLEKYGALPWSPLAQLELIVNEYDVNPRPRAILLTEGDEWKALGRLFEYYNFDPELLGIELRSIEGVGNFTLANWQVFIEYMHEKGVLVFFCLDAEGDAPRQARRLLERQRLFPSEGLTKVIPAEDRIRIWKTSFEEENFSDDEIAIALDQLGVGATKESVAAARKSRGCTGLIEHIIMGVEPTISKAELCMLLVVNLIKLRERDPSGTKRPIEEFVNHCGMLAIYNHQPTHRSTIALNRKSGYFG